MFLDEVNTSSCLGLFKEIIVDRTFDGEVSTVLGKVAEEPLYCQRRVKIIMGYKSVIHCGFYTVAT